MRNTETSAAEEYARRILPQVGFLFCAAHAMIGSRERAEVLLGTALSDFFAANDVFSARASLRSGILHEMKSGAMDMLRSDNQTAESDFPGFVPRNLAQGETVGPLVEHLSALPASVQRMMALKYGCQLNTHAIAALTQTAQEEVKTALGRARRQLIRSQGLHKDNAASLEQQLTREIRQAMSRSGSERADVSQILRTLEEDLASVRTSGHWVSRILRGVFMALLVCLLVAAAWILAVLIE